MALDLLEKLLSLNPAKRIPAKTALEHAYFKASPLPCPPEGLPKIEKDTHEYEVKISAANRQFMKSVVEIKEVQGRIREEKFPLPGKRGLSRQVAEQTVDMEPGTKVGNLDFHEQRK